MSVEIPLTTRVIINQDRVAALAVIPTPVLEDNEILIKVVAAALNPTDWKHITSYGVIGSSAGCDCAGEVVQIGPNINPSVSWKVGDRVAGLIHGGRNETGAFSEYTKLTADITWKIPENTSYEEAVTYGVSCMSPAQAMFHPDRLNLVSPPAQAPGNPWFFIYGGSTSLGHFAIQWAKLAGYRVVTTSSDRNYDNVKALGADAIFNHTDPDIVAKVKEATGDPIHHAFDTFSSDESQALSVQVLAPGPGHVIVVLVVSEAAKALRPDVTIQDTWLYSIFDRAWSIGPLQFPAVKADKDQMVELFARLPELVRERTLRPLPLKIWPGGLDGIPDAIQYMIDGKVSYEKIVFQLT